MCRKKIQDCFSEKLTWITTNMWFEILWKNQEISFLKLCKNPCSYLSNSKKKVCSCFTAFSVINLSLSIDYYGCCYLRQHCSRFFTHIPPETKRTIWFNCRYLSPVSLPRLSILFKGRHKKKKSYFFFLALAVLITKYIYNFFFSSCGQQWLLLNPAFQIQIDPILVP